MTADYPTDTAPATAEYVFELLRQFAGRLSGATPTWIFETLADEPADRHFGPFASEIDWALEEQFGISLPDAEWAALDPLSRRTVREVCAFVAARITRPVIRPWNHVGG